MLVTADLEGMGRKVHLILDEVIERYLVDSEAEIFAKGHQDVVTNLDYKMERHLKAALTGHFPETLFIGEEENHEQLTDAPTWVCDPIDGTLNFTKGIPYYGVQLALLIDKKPVMSFIDLPVLKDRYWAIQGLGAFCGDQRISADVDSVLGQVIVSFGDFSKSNPSSRGYQLNAISALLGKAMRIRIQGASSVDFAFVASQKNGCHILFSKNLWELAPGKMLAEEAGCVTMAIEGSRHGFEGQGLVVAINEHVLTEVMKAIEGLT